MDLITIIIIAILFLAVVYLYADKNKKTDQIPEKFKNFPYEKKYLLTKTEYAFYHELRKKCDEKGFLVFPKIRLEDYIKVNTKENALKYRGYIKSRHIDFIVCDSKVHLLCGIELDDKTHETEKAKENDRFKNELFKAIDLPLYRIKVSNDYSQALNGISEIKN